MRGRCTRGRSHTRKGGVFITSSAPQLYPQRGQKDGGASLRRCSSPCKKGNRAGASYGRARRSIARGKGVRVVGLHARKLVVHVAVVGLVRPNAVEDVAERCGRRQPVVLQRDGRRRGGRKHGEVALVELLQQVRVGLHRLLLQVAHEAVAEAWGDHVGEAEGPEEDPLPADDHDPEERPRLAQRHGDHEVHALVLRLGQQRVDPTVVLLHEAERVQVTHHASVSRKMMRFSHAFSSSVPM